MNNISEILLNIILRKCVSVSHGLKNCNAQSAENYEPFKDTSVAHFPLFPIHSFPRVTNSNYSALTRDFLCDFLCLKYCDSALNILIENYLKIQRFLLSNLLRINCCMYKVQKKT